MDLLIQTKQQLQNQLSLLKGNRILVAYSGGLDSSALLHCVRQADLSIPILAIHVNHGLSANSGDWVKHCERQCETLDIPLVVREVSLSPENGNIEDQARIARYEVFESIMEDGDILLMAHHQDDQIETFFMRLMRGSGLTGLSAIPMQRPIGKGYLVRPWLNVSRETLEAFVSSQGIQHIHDESNDLTHFDRNWWRHELLPKLTERYPQSSSSIETSIKVLQQERELLQDLIQPIYESVVDCDGRINCVELMNHSSAIQRQLIRSWLENLGSYPLLSQGQIQQVLKDVVGAQQDAEPVFRWHEQEIRRFNGSLYLVPHLPKIEDYQFPFNGTPLTLPQGQLSCIEGEGLLHGDYEVISYQGGLKAKPCGRSTKTLKKWFQDYQVPPWLRKAWPVIVKDDVVVAVPGLFICEGFTSQTGWTLDYIVNKK